MLFCLYIHHNIIIKETNRSRFIECFFLGSATTTTTDDVAVHLMHKKNLWIYENYTYLLLPPGKMCESENLTQKNVVHCS